VLKHYDINTNQWTTEKVTYYVSSTVLGSVISEVSATGAKERSFVFAGKDVMAIQNAGGSSQVVTWEHYDPSGASYRATNAQASGTKSGEMDPMGADAGIFKPLTWPQPTSAGRIERYYDVPELNSATQGCVLDRVPISCDVLQNLMNAGAVQQEYLLPIINDTAPKLRPAGTKRPEPSLKVVKVNIVPRGLGLFSTAAPMWVPDKEDGHGDWDSFTFAFDPIDWTVLESSLKTCIKELWDMFEVTAVKFTSPAGEGGKADDDTHNGVITLHDAQLGQTFNVVNDPTPPTKIKEHLRQTKSRGLTDTRNPFWTYAYPKAGPKTRPGEQVYPELFTQISMEYVRVQIHETGAALSAIRDIYHPAPWAPLEQRLDPGHPDDGPALEDCVGRTYFQQMGLTPHWERLK
jgi:hypothetical protein